MCSKGIYFHAHKLCNGQEIKLKFKKEILYIIDDLNIFMYCRVLIKGYNKFQHKIARITHRGFYNFAFFRSLTILHF